MAVRGLVTLPQTTLLAIGYICLERLKVGRSMGIALLLALVIGIGASGFQCLRFDWHVERRILCIPRWDISASLCVFIEVFISSLL